MPDGGASEPEARRPRTTATDLLRRSAYSAMTVLGRFPALVLPAARLLGHGVVLDREAEAVVEGFPRSGNSLAVAALVTSREPRPRIAHHLHASAHVLAAVKAGVPTLVLLRPPREAVVELVRSKPFLGLGTALRGYERFHRPLVAVREGFAVATFEEVTADPGVAARRLNERFGTSFPPPASSSGAGGGVDEAIEAYWRERRGPGLPLVGRSTASDGSRGATSLELDPTLLERAEELYRLLEPRA